MGSTIRTKVCSFSVVEAELCMLLITQYVSPIKLNLGRQMYYDLKIKRIVRFYPLMSFHKNNET